MHERKFQKTLDNLINMKISLFLSDDQFIEGFLLDVKQDHIVVDVNQNIYYFALQHIQALSKNAKDFSVSSEIVHYVNKNYLEDVLKALRYNWVSINSLGDQVLFGVLSTVDDDHITVINNSELLYIPKSNLSNINGIISEEQIISINTQKQPEIQDCQIEKQTTGEHTQTTNEIERVTTIEVPVLEISANEEVEDKKVTSEKSGFYQKTRVEIYTALLNLLKQNILNRDIDNERREGIFQETAIHGFVPQIDDKLKGQSDSSVLEMQDNQIEGQVIVEHTQTINEAKTMKNFDIPNIEDSAEEGNEIGSNSTENTEVSSKTVSSEVPDHSRLVKSDLLKRIDGKSLEDDYPDVVETKEKRKRKRVLLTAWSAMNDDQNAITCHNNFAEGNELRDSVMMEQSSDPIHSKPDPLHDPYPNKDFVTSEEKLEFAETTICQVPVSRINLKAEKEMLEKQYYALMKQAETNCFHMAERHLNLSEERQYLALMNHAAKRYQEFKD